MLALQSFSRHPSPSRGFTLIEILVVVAILAVLAAIAFPVLGNMRKRANTAEGTNNLRQIGVAMTTYHSEHGLYPGAHYKDPDTEKRTNWRAALADYLDENQRGWDAEIFSCPNVEEKWTGGWGGKYPPSYSCNPALITSSSLEGERAVNVPRPAETVLVMDASTMNNGAADGNLYGISGSPNFATRSPEQAITISSYGSSPRATPRFRQGNGTTDKPGTANTLFVDGHVQQVPYGELKYKNFRIDY
jgi:prepilin-type N-terminal cleavage/methylation domain-containing protein/prepilin-type processing-associated H-X9-DG protein